MPNSQVYFADFHAHPNQEEWILAVREDHRCSSGQVINTIVAIDLVEGKTHSLAKGADFYTHRRFDPSGTRVCWTQWHHPNMLGLGPSFLWRLGKMTALWISLPYLQEERAMRVSPSPDGAPMVRFISFLISAVTGNFGDGIQTWLILFLHPFPWMG
jgi:hypothetical protein